MSRLCLYKTPLSFMIWYVVVRTCSRWMMIIMHNDDDWLSLLLLSFFFSSSLVVFIGVFLVLLVALPCCAIFSLARLLFVCCSSHGCVLMALAITRSSLLRLCLACPILMNIHCNERLQVCCCDAALKLALLRPSLFSSFSLAFAFALSCSRSLFCVCLLASCLLLSCYMPLPPFSRSLFLSSSCWCSLFFFLSPVRLLR